MIHVKGGGGANRLIKELFGDASDGVAIVSSNTTWNAPTEDTGMIVKNFDTLTIAAGVTVSAGNRNAGMIIKVQGDCTIAGALANNLAPKTLLDSDNVDFSVYPPSMLTTKAGNGGAGAAGGLGSLFSLGENYTGTALVTYGTASAGGSAMLGRFYGGGFGGGGGGGMGGGGYGDDPNNRGGAGGSASGITTATEMFVGGESWFGGKPGTYGGGGGGATGYNGNAGSYFHGWFAYDDDFGRGGTGASGAGGKGGYINISDKTIMNPSAGGGGAGGIGGGVIILFVGGKLTLTGTINCSGKAGGAGGNGGGVGLYPYGTDTRAVNIESDDVIMGAGGAGSGGGGGGGGRIYIVHKGAITRSGTLNVNGGAGGARANGGAIGVPHYSNAGSAGAIGTTSILTFDNYKAQEVS